MINLARGEPYPMPILQKEGAAAQFLMTTGNVLQIVLPGMTSKEENALRSGMIKAGFMYEAGAMLLLFQFYSVDGKPCLTFDAPYDIRLLPADKRALHSIENIDQRLAIEVHIVDEKNIVRGLRLVTMPNAMTVSFLSAVQEQLVESKTGDRKMTEWLNCEPRELINKTKTWVLGK